MSPTADLEFLALLEGQTFKTLKSAGEQYPELALVLAAYPGATVEIRPATPIPEPPRWPELSETQPASVAEVAGPRHGPLRAGELGAAAASLAPRRAGLRQAATAA